MSTEENKQLAQRWYNEVWNSGNMASFDELIALDFTEHAVLPTGPIPPGREGLRPIITSFLTSFPDIHFTPEDMIAEGDKLVVRFISRGTDRGGFGGMPPTGKSATVPGIDIYRFANGKMVEHWGQVDFLGLLTQLGVIPTPGQPT
ncbi:MAG: ester cyclase [Candidatus Chloroheliales bacterium]|nr:MAG: ester cyclase [Chloroflexota bacterium]